MGRTVRELDASLTAEEWTEWVAYYSLHPWGCRVEDNRWDALLRMFFSVNRGAKSPPTPSSFFDRDPEGTRLLQAEAERGVSVVDRIRAWFGGRAVVAEPDALDNMPPVGPEQVAEL